MIRITTNLVCVLLMLASCKHAAINVELTPIISISKTHLNVGDSLLVSVDNAPQNTQIQLTPNLGELQSNSWYKAPSTLLNNNTTVTFSLSTAQATATVVLQKNNVNDTVISFSKTIMPLLVANCNFSGCHGNGSSAGKINLSNYNHVVKNLTIYQPSKSILYTSLLKPDPLRRMPPAGQLHTYKINHIHKWIEQGALNN